MTRTHSWLMLAVSLSAFACSTVPAGEGGPDAGPGSELVPDSGMPDLVDAGADPADAGPSQQSDPDAGPTQVVWDAGPTPSDAGAPFTDAGPPFSDAGTPSVDAGAPSGPDLGDTVPDAGAVCTSGVYWLLGNVGTDVMNPGQACIACHATNNGPKFTAAGTVYPTAHEPNNCDGVTSGWTIVITDAAGNKISMTPTLSGSFDTSTAIVFPYTVQITGNGYTREMLTPQTTGDCNSCHTQDGTNGAPGRIVVP